MRFRWRKTFVFGPLRFRFANGRYTGMSVRVGRWTWQPRTGKHSLDTPGPGSWHWGGRRRV